MSGPMEKIFFYFSVHIHLKMGSSFSKEKPVAKAEQALATVKTEEGPALNERAGSKRSIEADDSKPHQSKKKRTGKKDAWSKKGKKEGVEKKIPVGGLQVRPDCLGPREPRIPKKKVALFVGYNGTGYQGMQL